MSRRCSSQSGIKLHESVSTRPKQGQKAFRVGASTFWLGRGGFVKALLLVVKRWPVLRRQRACIMLGLDVRNST